MFAISTSVGYLKPNPFYTNKQFYFNQFSLSRLRISHTRITRSFLLEGKQQPMCYACLTKYTGKHILVECTNLVHIRKTFYSANNIKELLQNTEIDFVISFLKTVKLYKKSKEIYNKTNYFYKPFLYKIYSNKLIPSTTCFTVCLFFFFFFFCFFLWLWFPTINS